MKGGCEDETELDRLRQRAESAIRRARSRTEVEPLLERIAAIAEEGSEAATFAHRHLAEILLEDHPWRAALHLRCVAREQPDDDVVHALMGLCQALLGNFQSAVAAYRRALQIAPRNPWYHHNLGHLLDVALGQPDQAAPHLHAAHRMEPEEHEITASLAHCLARLGELDEARALAEEAVHEAPRNRDHRALLAWIEAGAPRDGGPHGASGGSSDVRRGATGAPTRRSPRTTPSRGPSHEVLRVLERGMREAGFSPGQLERARALWTDFRDGRRIRVVKPEVFAAAVEYAIALVHGLHGVTQASVARRYGVAPASLSNRYGEIRDALALRPGDPRYASSK